MITYFYKILYDNKDVVYVGVTTRKITKRFQEHIKTKNLNDRYTCVEFDKLIHPPMDSIDTFYAEYRKVADLERKYIQEEKDKGSSLLNISKGGEWGTDILSKLRKKNFLEKYKSYDGYRTYTLNKLRVRQWLISWVKKSTNNKTKIWLRYWIKSKSINILKRWLYNWAFNKSNNKTKIWIIHWIKWKLYCKTKGWLFHWIKKMATNRTKGWLLHWISHRKECRTKVWIQHWIFHRKECRTKTWLNHWIFNTVRKKNKILINDNG